MRILAVAAHPDDIELAMGGTIYRFREEWQITWLVLSHTLVNSKGETFATRDLQELEAAAKILGHITLQILDLPGQRFPEHRQTVIEALLQHREGYDLVFVPSVHDLHQDHQTVAQEAARVFRTNLVSYSVPSSALRFEPNVLVKLSVEEVAAKIAATRCYSSQYNTNQSKGYYFNEDAIRANLQRWQNTSGGMLEGFAVQRLVV